MNIHDARTTFRKKINDIDKDLMSQIDFAWENGLSVSNLLRKANEKLTGINNDSKIVKFGLPLKDKIFCVNITKGEVNITWISN